MVHKKNYLKNPPIKYFFEICSINKEILYGAFEVLRITR
jgi:hypothetical protein